jgi:hypothetical protein
MCRLSNGWREKSGKRGWGVLRRRQRAAALGADRNSGAGIQKADRKAAPRRAGRHHDLTTALMATPFSVGDAQTQRLTQISGARRTVSISVTIA